MHRIYHPCDGGADDFLMTSEERDRTRDRHADWLSGHLTGRDRFGAGPFCSPSSVSSTRRCSRGAGSDVRGRQRRRRAISAAFLQAWERPLTRPP
ncbi:DUF3885 domain-containing protein [Streptomyces albogriseolus]|uniref:DUF3885 domain-containing protein n=1 Tax=Streptomyces albogriseolus TaxID=1887 RepID=UPI003CF070FA